LDVFEAKVNGMLIFSSKCFRVVVMVRVKLVLTGLNRRFWFWANVFFTHNLFSCDIYSLL